MFSTSFSTRISRMGLVSLSACSAGEGSGQYWWGTEAGYASTDAPQGHKATRQP